MRDLSRRELLSWGWKVGVGLVAVAGGWTTWDVLRPRLSAGIGGVVRTLPEAAVPGDEAVAVQAARAYLTKAGDEVVAISEVCPHLGCRVEWCDSSRQFECPCHGSIFNRLGKYRSGPTPRGMDRHPAVVVDGVVEVDTGETLQGDPPGVESIDEPAAGPSCIEGTHS